MLGRWDESDGPLYGRLARAVARLLEGGLIGSGTALPAERQLAGALSVSRNTVSAAYAELRRDGWIEARQGSATVVTGAKHSPVAAYKTNGLFASLMRNHPDVVDLTVAVPDAAPVVAEVMSDPSAFLDDPAAVTAGHGYFPAGYQPLREALAPVLSRNGLPTSPEELMVTSGAQQAISLVAQATIRAGDRVVVEEFTYPGALDLATSSGAVLTPVPIGPHGVDLAAFDRETAAGNARLAYLVPTFHNPTGAVLDFPSRQHLVRTIAEQRVTTIDDLTLAELDFVSPAPPPLAALAPEAPIISVGSMSKVFWGGLRIGWVRARQPVIDHLVGFKASADLGTQRGGPGAGSRHPHPLRRNSRVAQGQVGGVARDRDQRHRRAPSGLGLAGPGRRAPSVDPHAVRQRLDRVLPCRPPQRVGARPGGAPSRRRQPGQGPDTATALSR